MKFCEVEFSHASTIELKKDYLDRLKFLTLFTSLIGPQTIDPNSATKRGQKHFPLFLDVIRIIVSKAVSNKTKISWQLKEEHLIEEHITT